jgi:hypothetical protein
MLGVVAERTDHLVTVLETGGMIQQLRDSPAYNLRQLDRSLPNYTIGDLLLACEAYATVTAPSALATDDLGQVRDGARHILQLLQGLLGSIRGRQHRTMMGTTITGMQATLLRSTFDEPTAQAALAALIDSLSVLVALEGGQPRQHKHLLPIGKGYFVPTTVLGGAIALIVFLLTSIGFATGQVASSPNGLNFSAISGNHGVSPTTTAGPNAGTHQPTPTPRPGATATPRPPGAPTWSVSPLNLQPCPNAQFTITYISGPGPISWTAASDSSYILLNQSGGQLQPGGSVAVTVTATMDTGQPGSITVSAHDALPTQQVQYDTGC